MTNLTLISTARARARAVSVEIPGVSTHYHSLQHCTNARRKHKFTTLDYIHCTAKMKRL